MQSRRDFLIGAASLATLIATRDGADGAQNKTAGWNSGDVAHLLPTVNHQRFLIKASFTRPRQAPSLLIDRRKVAGRAADTLPSVAGHCPRNSTRANGIARGMPANGPTIVRKQA